MYNWYAVAGITVAERSTHASRNRCKKTISPVTTFLVMGMDDINYFRGNADNGGKMKEREKHWKTPNADATIAVVLQLFREGIMDQWGIRLHWRTWLLVEFYGERQTPGPLPDYNGVRQSQQL
jgi:hypothetical protein